MIFKLSLRALVGFTLLALAPVGAFARDVKYEDSEVSVFVNPGEPTQIQFPGDIQGGVKRKLSTLSIDHKNSDLILFATENINESGEAIIVRLKDGRSYSVRVRRATASNRRDDVVRLEDSSSSSVFTEEEQDPAYREKTFSYAPPSQISGLMRELVLQSEFGKKGIQGYRASDRYKGDPVLSDGTLKVSIERIYMGPNLWGYVLDAENMLDIAQRLNPATFRLDGTRAVSMEQWELAARPITTEQQIAGKHKTKIYVVTRAKSSK